MFSFFQSGMELESALPGKSAGNVGGDLQELIDVVGVVDVEGRNPDGTGQPQGLYDALGVEAGVHPVKHGDSPLIVLSHRLGEVQALLRFSEPVFTAISTLCIR